jgi:PAS domain S-box-containing protein
VPTRTTDDRPDPILPPAERQPGAPEAGGDTDAALRASGERRELAEMATGVGVFELDLAGNGGTWSTEIYRLHGIPSATQPSSQAWLAAVHPDDRVRIQVAVAALIEAAHQSPSARYDLWEDEYRVVLPGGVVRWIASRVRVVLDAAGQPARLLGVNFDVTDQKRAEAALKASEERLRLATEALAGFLYDWDPATNHMEWFGGMEEVLGFRLDEVSLDLAWYEARVHPEDLAHAWEVVRAAFESGAPGYSHVYRFLHRDGHYVHVADRSHIIRDEVGRPIRVVGGVSDISERLGLESQRAELLEREHEARSAAESTSRAWDALLSIVSHDLGNPLSTVRVCAAALLDPEPPPLTSVRDMGRIIQSSASLMQEIVHNLLDRARLDAGNVSDIIAPVYEMFAPVAAGCGLELTVESVAGLPPVDVDPYRLQQVLSNLLGNAMKFTPAGGRVLLAARLDEQESADALPAVRFAVSDTGPGIVPEDLPHIFDWLWQAPRGGREGAGLGLAIARGLIEIHGGRLSVETAPGQGTTFWFSVPATTSPPSKPQTVPPPT